MKVNVFYNDKIKLQGISYYTDCYKFWDLNHCKDNFESEQYDSIVFSLNNNTHKLYGRENMAVINLQNYDSFDDYKNSLSTNIQRDILNSTKNKFYFKEFDFNDHVFDFSEINHSQSKKKNGINSWYLQDPKKYLGSQNNERHHWEDDRHYSKWFGLFKYYKNYKQGDLKTNEKLFAYCKLNVDGEMASIGLIWSHANYLKDGLMFSLITSLVEEVMKNKNIKIFVYYGFNQYSSWKRRMLFEPMKINISLT
jgi:hypothetical protein